MLPGHKEHIMKHNTTDKSNLRSAKTKIALTLASIFIACVVCLGVFCISDGAFSFDNAGEPLTAYAADVSSESAFISAINSNTAINLTEDITISYQRELQREHIHQADQR